MINCTFVWGNECAVRNEMIKLSMTTDELKARDAEGISLLSAKLRFTSPATDIDMEPYGPGDNEFMSPCLIKFVWAYIKNGDSSIPPELEADDAVRALEYFGFPGVNVVVPESDPYYIGKQLAYKAYVNAMKIAPSIVVWIKKELLSTTVGSAGAHFIADDESGIHTNQFCESVDPLMAAYRVSVPAGTHVARLGSRFEPTQSSVFRLLGGTDKNASALRNKVQLDVNALGGIKVEWASKVMPIADIGEYGNKEYSRATRWILKITLNNDRLQASTEGIKRRKVE